MKRGQIWWASLPAPAGSGPGYKRPVVIIQADEFNKSRIHTVVVAVITSNLRLSKAPGNIELEKTKTGLNKKSVINSSQIITIDKQFLKSKAGQLNKSTLQQLNEGIELVLGL